MVILKEGKIEGTTHCTKPPKLPEWEKSLQELHLCVWQLLPRGWWGLSPPELYKSLSNPSVFFCLTSVMWWQTAMLFTSAVPCAPLLNDKPPTNL